MNIKEDDIVLCVVKRIEGTTVFVEIQGNIEGSIVMSEVAAGRIRNLREYVAPNKRIVCKVLKMFDGHPQLSLRRVTAKERENIEEQDRKEKTFTSLLKTIASDSQQIIENIKVKYEIWDFLEKIKLNPQILDEFFKKEQANQLIKVLSEKEEREKEVKKIFILKNSGEEGIDDIKSTLKIPNTNIIYLGSSKFAISMKGKDFKEANLKANEILSKIEKIAKEKKCYFEYKENQQ